MRPCLRVLTGLIVGIACVAAPGVARADFVVNGGFEIPPQGNGFVTDWTVSGNTSDPTSFGVDSSDPHTGQFAAFFGPQANPAFLMQTLATVPGITYTLDFWLQNEDANSPNEFSVAFGSQVLLDQVGVPANGYQEYTFNVTVTEASTVLSFGFRNDFAFFDIDDISVVRAVPEPASLICMAIGAALVGGYGQRKRPGRATS